MLWKITLRNLFLCVLSAGLLVLAFPKTDFWFLAWFGLIPLMIVLDGKSRLKAFGLGYFSGLVFFAGTLFWLGHVTIVGIIGLVIYLSLYFGLWSVFYVHFKDKSFLNKLILIPSAWAAVEYTRMYLFSGFGWVALGYSQSKFITFIQIADVVGTLGISFFLVMFNVFFKEFYVWFVFWDMGHYGYVPLSHRRK